MRFFVIRFNSSSSKALNSLWTNHIGKMDIQLAENIWLRDSSETPFRPYCVISEERIHGLYFDFRSPNKHEPSEGDSATWATIDVSNLEQLTTALRAFEPEQTHSDIQEIIPNVTYKNSLLYVLLVDLDDDDFDISKDGVERRCTVCSNEIEIHDSCVFIEGINIHYSCVEEFNAIFEQAWEEYSDEILVDSVNSIE